eukprot:TRINITY_DN18126_c0_g1_i1.p1 TRINITY_DN18126_c0_g1~~TRINITY_DN18126_c0_g1_i1.p1  ORF type:complete len:237 (-),score=30.69 TRINITY_DN18126_c0_g1_i1:27-737(-)
MLRYAILSDLLDELIAFKQQSWRGKYSVKTLFEILKNFEILQSYNFSNVVQDPLTQQFVEKLLGELYCIGDLFPSMTDKCCCCRRACDLKTVCQQTAKQILQSFISNKKDINQIFKVSRQNESFSNSQTFSKFHAFLQPKKFIDSSQFINTWEKQTYIFPKSELSHPKNNRSQIEWGRTNFFNPITMEKDEEKRNQAIIRMENLCSQCCLLYTSDAADEEDSVDIVGSRIIEKKKT